MNPIASFERDVLECGVPMRDARALGKRYGRALRSGACVDWIELYVGCFATLLREAHCTRPACAAAARRLLNLLGDDLGAQLFHEDARATLSQHLHGEFRRAS